MYRLKEYSESELPAVNDAIESGLALSQQVETNWSFHKDFDGVKTYTTWLDGDYWAARVSYHDDITYEEALSTLLDGHTENEAEYIKMIESYELLGEHRGWRSRKVLYKFPAPLKKRDMVFWLAQKETKPGSQFVNVTIPRKLNAEHTKAVYVSMEVVTKLEDGRLQWIMGTTSDAGGWVPQFVQRPQMGNAVAEDVPQYKKWLKTRAPTAG